MGAPDHKGPPKATEQQQQETAPTEALGAPVKEQAASQKYDPKCTDPKDHNEADFCAQSGMAKAASEQLILIRAQNRLLSDQNLIIGVEALLLVLAVIFSACAALASSRAANRMLQVDRPFLSMAEMTSDGLEILLTPPITDGERPIGIRCKIHNHGTRVGFLQGIAMDYRFGELPAEPPAIVARKFNWYYAVEAGETFTPTALAEVLKIQMSAADKVIANKSEFFVFGFVLYSDMHGMLRRSGFAVNFVAGSVGNDETELPRFMTCGPATYWYDKEDSCA